MDSLKTLIVIPCYQEASRLDPGKFTEFLQSNDDVGFVFVDDGSTDGTADVIEDAVNRHPRRIAGLRNETNMGKGESVRRGVLYAADKAACIGYWDADLSTPLAAIPELVAALDLYDAWLVMGSRLKITGHEIVRKPWRHYPGRVFATLASLVTGHGFYDTQCGAKVFRSGIVESCFGRPFLSRWCFDIELLLRLMESCDIDDVNTLESGLIEYPLRQWIDSGDTRLQALDVLRMAADLGRIFYTYRLTSSR